MAIALKDDLGVIPMNEPEWGSMPNDVFEKTRLAPLYRDVLAQDQRRACLPAIPPVGPLPRLPRAAHDAIASPHAT